MSSGGQSPPSLDAILPVGTVEAGASTGDNRLCLLDSQGKLVAVGRPRADQTLELLRVFNA